MKKKRKILLIVVLVLVIAAAVAGIWQRKNIEAVYMVFKYDSDELLEKMNEKQAEGTQTIASYFSDGLREYTPDEKAAIDSGETTQTQVIAKILDEKSKQIESGEQTGYASTVSVQEKIISKYASKMYALEGEYLGGIESIMGAAFNYYKSIATKNNDSSAALTAAAEYSGKLYSLESACDAEVETLLSEMKTELLQNGCDTSAVSAMRKAYEAEKASKRAYYLSLHSLDK